jgi:uncharacterized membrane protein
MGKLREANPAKFYIAKYFFLIMALLPWMVALAMNISLEHSPKNTAVIFLFICLGSLFMVAFAYLQLTMKRVAIGKHKLVVIHRKKKVQLRWPDVKSINLIPFFNVYKLELKNSRHPIFFFPSKNIEPAYDLLAQDTSKSGSIISKRKRELGI